MDKQQIRQQCDISDWCKNDCQKCEVGQRIILNNALDELKQELFKPFLPLIEKICNWIEKRF